MPSEKGLTPKKETQNKTNNELNNEESSDTAIALESDDKTRFSIRIWSLILVALVIFCTVITPLPASAANNDLCTAIKRAYYSYNGSGWQLYGPPSTSSSEGADADLNNYEEWENFESYTTQGAQVSAVQEAIQGNGNTVIQDNMAEGGSSSYSYFVKDLKSILNGKNGSGKELDGLTVSWSQPISTSDLSSEALGYIYAMFASWDGIGFFGDGTEWNTQSDDHNEWANVHLFELEDYFSDYDTLYRGYATWSGHDENIDPGELHEDINESTGTNPYEPTYYELITNESSRLGDDADPSKVLREYEDYGYILDSGGDLFTFMTHPGATLKAWLVGGVAGSYAGALDSISSVTAKTRELLTRNLDADGANATIYNTVKTICNNVIVPIGGVMLAFIFAYEIYELVCERNNMNDIGAGSFIQLFIKMFIAIIVVINAWNLTEWVFSIGNWIVNQAVPTIDSMDKNDNLFTIVNQWDALTDADTKLKSVFAYYICVNDDINFGSTLVLLLQGIIINIGMLVVSLLIYVIVWVRMIEIYLYCAVAPIPLATLTNRSWGQVGMGFIRQVAGLAFQAFIIILCLGVFQVLLGSTFNANNISSSAALTKEMWSVIGYSIILVFCLFKSGSLAKSMMGAH